MFSVGSFSSNLTRSSKLLSTKLLKGFAPFMFPAILLCPASGAESGPQLPCGQEPVPPYPSLDNSPIVKVWSASDLGRGWMPPECTGWTDAGFATLITTVARFRYAPGREALLRHIGAISELAGVRYWSTTHQQWQTLITDAYALTGSQTPQGRRDFTPDEVKEGSVLYFEQADNLAGKGTYRLHIAKASRERIVFDVENTSSIRFLLLTLFHPGGMQSVYFLDREPENVWGYYSIARTAPNTSPLLAGHDSSWINRAVAFYRALAGIPTDQEPPAAR
jgi:hypothetical protein